MAVMLTPEEERTVSYKIKKSKFIASINSVNSKQKAIDYRDNIARKYRDATHNVWAYRIKSGQQTREYSDDDGEPAGSSGSPVLQKIIGNNLINTIIVINRYFGGIKLGIGGLIRAYGTAAELVIQEVSIKQLQSVYRLMVIVNYDQLGIVLGQIESMAEKILATEYNNSGCNIFFVLKKDYFTKLQDKLINVSGNQVVIKKLKLFMS